MSFDTNYLDSQFKNNGNLHVQGTDAQAPGMPTEKEGYLPPKKWDGKKIRSSNGRGYGWPDSNGKIWIPTGVGPNAHGGPHWDAQ